MPDNETPRGNLPMAVPRDFPDALPLIIMQDQVVFPLALVPISIRSESEFRLINDVHNGDRLVAIAAAKDGEESKQSMADVYDVGCIARIVQVQHGHNGHVDVMLQTLKRCRITGFIRREPYPVARILPMEDIIKDKQKLDALAATIKTQMGQLIALSPNIPDGVKIIIEKVRSKTMNSETVGIDPNGPDGYNIDNVEYAQRLTFSGEFVHAAPWSVGSQGRANVSHGCTGMSTSNAGWFYSVTQPGDVVEYTGTNRPMTLTNGYGDWNLSWDDWVKGSALP